MLRPVPSIAAVASFGIGAAHVPDHEGSQDCRVMPLPALDRSFSAHPHGRFGLAAGYRPGYDGDAADSPRRATCLAP